MEDGQDLAADLRGGGGGVALESPGTSGAGGTWGSEREKGNFFEVQGSDPACLRLDSLPKQSLRQGLRHVISFER